jgi:dTMP kinase
MADETSGAPDPQSNARRVADSSVYSSLFRNRPFRNLTLATLASAFGDWIGFLAIIALTADILGPTRAAAFAVSGVMAARVLPSLLLAPVAGVFVDRWDRKRVLIATDIGRGLVMAMIPFTQEVFTLVLATLVIEVMSSLFAPAKDAVLPTLVRERELVGANQINLVTTYGTLPVAAVIYAGLLAAAVAWAPDGSFVAERPLAVPIWFNAVSFWVSATLLSRLTFPRVSAVRPVDPTTSPGPWEELKEGFRFIGGQPVIRTLIIGVMVAFASAGVVITTGEFFANLLNAGPSGYGILVAIVGAGLVSGLALAAPLTRRIEPERLFAPGIGIAGGSLVITATMPNLWAVTPFALAMGAGSGIAFICGYTVLQRRSDDRIRGRTFAAFNAGVRLSIFGSALAVPALIGVLGRERRALVSLDDGSQAVLYPYSFGGVRITLMAAGILAIAGAIWTGRTLRRALDGESVGELDLPTAPEAHDLQASRHGLFVVFEGGDGAGKSTQLRLLRADIERAGYDAVVTREPGGTRLGEAIRDVLLSHDSHGMSARTEALLYAAARAQHVDEVIAPALEKGAIVLCDRYVGSSVVYQGAARGLGEAAIARLNKWATAELDPDIVVLLDIDPSEGLLRAGSDGDPDRLEAAGLEFHQLVRDAYRRLAARDPDGYLVVDANQSVEALHATIREAVLLLIEARPDDVQGAAPSEVADPNAADERTVGADPARVGVEEESR